MAQGPVVDPQLGNAGRPKPIWQDQGCTSQHMYPSAASSLPTESQPRLWWGLETELAALDGCPGPPLPKKYSPHRANSVSGLTPISLTEPTMVKGRRQLYRLVLSWTLHSLGQVPKRLTESSSCRGGTQVMDSRPMELSAVSLGLGLRSD